MTRLAIKACCALPSSSTKERDPTSKIKLMLLFLAFQNMERLRSKVPSLLGTPTSFYVSNGAVDARILKRIGEVSIRPRTSESPPTWQSHLRESTTAKPAC
jgi:hypothetical protein